MTNEPKTIAGPIGIWACKIGETKAALPAGADAPMRAAVERAYRELTGEEAAFTFSGWSAELTEGERAVVENRLPQSPNTTPAEPRYPKLPYPAYCVDAGSGGSIPGYAADQMHAYYNLGRDKAKAWMRLADQRAIEVAELKVELGRLRALAASPTAQAAPVAHIAPSDMVEVCREDANNYCRILRVLGMEEEGDAVAEVKRLHAAQATPGLSEQDAGLLEQGASMLEALSGDERNRGNDSAAMGADCSAHAVRRLAAKLLAAPVAEGDALALRMFDAGWKAAARLCERDDVVADGIIGFGACPQFEAEFAAALAAQKGGA